MDLKKYKHIVVRKITSCVSDYNIYSAGKTARLGTVAERFDKFTFEGSRGLSEKEMKSVLTFMQDLRKENRKQKQALMHVVGKIESGEYAAKY